MVSTSVMGQRMGREIFIDRAHLYVAWPHCHVAWSVTGIITNMETTDDCCGIMEKGQRMLELGEFYVYH